MFILPVVTRVTSATNRNNTFSKYSRMEHSFHAHGCVRDA